MIDVGFLAQLKAGRIDALPELVGFSPEGVEFAGGRFEPFDAVIAATGYRTGLPDLLAEPDLLDPRGYPREKLAARQGLFFAGFKESVRGQLFDAARTARPMAAAIDRYLERMA
jgi:hypothetical protein